MKTSTLPTLKPESTACQTCEGCLGRREFFRLGLGVGVAATVAAALPSQVAAASLSSLPTSNGSEDQVRYPVPSSEGVSVDRKHEVILVRRGGLVAAFALSCPHQRSMLRWREKDGIFQCTKHHSQYSPTGVYEKGRATRNMDRLAIRLDGSEVVVDPGTTYHSDEDPQGWAKAVTTVP